MRILVTGGAGFIGSHLADRLLEDGHEVVIVDNESTGRRENAPERATYVKGDVTKDEDLDPLFDAGLDAVCHIAGHASNIGSYHDPVYDLRTNVLGTVNVLGRCLTHRVPRLLYASSMTVYGQIDKLPTPESTVCLPCSYYGISKYAAERYVHTTAERTDLGFEFNVTSFRMYNVYGPRQALDNPYQGVLSIFLGNVLRGEPVTIFGDGEQSRDFVYVGDVVAAWAAALVQPAAGGKVFNLGSGKRTTVNELADTVLDVLESSRAEQEVRYADARSGEQRHVEADIRQASSVLGWQPTVPFADGLAKTVHWAQEEHAAANRRLTLTAS